MLSRRFSLVLLLCGAQAHCAKILCVFNVPSISHQIVFQPIWKELSLRGHEVVVLAPNPLNDPTLVNLTEIDLGVLYSSVEDFIHNATTQGLQHWDMIKDMVMIASAIMEDFFSDSEVLKIINDNDTKFDVVLAEAVFPVTFAFASRFNCPVVGIASLSVTEHVHSVIGNPGHPVLYPDIMTDYGESLSFFRRIDAVLFHAYNNYVYLHRFIPAMDSIIRKYFGEQTPSLLEIEKNVSVLLLNTSPVLHKPRPYGPNIIELGGKLHIKQPKPLPKELQQYLDDSQQGVIYFSLGSNIKSRLLEESKRKTIMETFSELPYNVLWKFENDTLEGKPRNVRISKWLPQQDLLRHPNIKLFITQGGLQSLEEAVTRGIPLLVIPFMGDQFQNADRIERLGCGLQLNYKDLTKQSLKSSILTIIDDSRYKRKAQEIGRLIQDEPMSALQKAVWWIEYVIRNKGATHLKSPLVDMPWYQYYLLDVYLFFCFVVALACFVTYKTVELTYLLCCTLVTERKVKRP